MVKIKIWELGLFALAAFAISVTVGHFHPDSDASMYWAGAGAGMVALIITDGGSQWLASKRAASSERADDEEILRRIDSVRPKQP